MSDRKCNHPLPDGSTCDNPARNNGSCWISSHGGDVEQVGRPSKISKVGDEIISHIKSGLSMQQACQEVGVSTTTVCRWLNKGENNANSEYTSFFKNVKQTDWWESKKRFENGCSKVKVECAVCGAEKEVYPNRAEKYEKHYCLNHRPTAKGENSPNWKDNSRQYEGPNWSEQREKALKRDFYKCQSCGLANDTHREKWDQSLHVHHIIPRSEFDHDDPQQNELTNLITLCRNCHDVYEGTQLSPVEIPS